MRRFSVLFLSVVVLLGTVFVGRGAVVAAQEATPESGLADLGLPTLDVTVTATGYEDIPESLEAGRYLVTVTVQEDAGEFGGGVAFIQPLGMSAEEFLGLLSGPPDETGVGAVPGTPIDEANATPAGGEGMGGPPPEYFDATFAGGAFALTGQSKEIVLDLGPGEWIAWADDPASPQEPVVFEVTGEMPTDLTEPESSATITMGEYVIGVKEGELTSGQQILKIENQGAQPHFIVAAKGPEDLTEAQIGVIVEEEGAAQMTGTPPVYSDLNPDEDFDLENGFFTGTQSTGTTTWVPVDLEAGSYAMLCFFPDIADGMPHAAKGMYAVVEVRE